MIFAKRIDRYLAGYILSVMASVLGVLVGLMLLHRFYKIIDLAVSRALSLFQTFQLVAWAFPLALLYALPMATLAATLISFGKFSADEEATACMAAGISRARLAAVPLALAVIFSAFTFVNNTVLIPESYRFFDRIGFGVGVDPFKSLTPGQMARIEGRFFSAGAVNPDAQSLTNFFALVPASDMGIRNANQKIAIVAASGRWVFSEKFLVLQLENGSSRDLQADAAIMRTVEFREMRFKIPLTYYESSESKRLRTEELWARRTPADVTEIFRRFGGALSGLILVYCSLPLVLRARGSVRRSSARGAVVYAIGFYFLFWLGTFLAESAHENYGLHAAILAAPYLGFGLIGAALWTFRR